MAPYNRSYGAVRRQLDFLEIMREEKKDHVFPTEEPRSTAYKIREAMFAAQFHDQYSQYASLRHEYQIKELPGRVMAKFLGSADVRIESEPDKPHTMRVTEAKDLSSVVGALIQYENTVSEITFPNAVLETHHLERLYRLCENKGWFIINQEEAGITLSQKEEVSEIAWTPESDTSTSEETE